MFANANRDTKKTKEFVLTDFIKLSFDDKAEQEKAKSIPDDAFEQLTQKWGKTLDGSK